MTNISNKDELRQLIARYARGNATREEIIFLRNYYAYFDDQPNGLQDLSDEERAHLKAEMFEVIDRQLEHRNPWQNSTFWLRRVAAVLIFLVVAGVALWVSPFYVNIDYVEEYIPAQITQTVTMTFEAEDKILHHYLPDGSYVALEPGSEISYQIQFNEEFREVVLEGEAFFDVQHDDDRPFIVQTNGVSTRVLGTAFRISSIENENEFSISVTRGKVEVSDGNNQLDILEKNDQLTMDVRTNEFVKTKLNKTQTVNLEPEKYVLDDVNVGEAVRIISKRWNCEFEILNRELYNCEFTTSFLPTDDLHEIVAVMAAVVGAEYNIEGQVVTLKGKGCMD